MIERGKELRRHLDWTRTISRDWTDEMFEGPTCTKVDPLIRRGRARSSEGAER